MAQPMAAQKLLIQLLPRLHLFHQGQEGICAAANRGTAEAHAPIIPRMVCRRFFSSFSTQIGIRTSP